MALDDARVQDIRDGYESRIADLEATVAALREGHADADTALLEACREALIPFASIGEDCANDPDWEWEDTSVTTSLEGTDLKMAVEALAKLNERLNSTASVAKGD